MSKDKQPIKVRVYERDVCKFECGTENDAFLYLLRAQPHSVYHAINDGEWNVFVDYEDRTIKWNEEYYGI